MMPGGPGANRQNHVIHQEWKGTRGQTCGRGQQGWEQGLLH